MEKKFYGFKAAAATVTVMFCSFAVFTLYSCLMPDIMARLEIDATTVGLGITISSMIGFVLSFVAGKVYEKMPSNFWMRMQPIVIIVLMLAYLYAPSIYIIWGLHIFYGIVWGFGYTNGAIVYISQWFIERRDEMVGYVNSGVTLGGALSSFVFGIFSRSMETTRSALILIIVFGVIAVLSSFMMFLPTKFGQKPYGYKEQEVSAEDDGTPAEVPGVEVKAAVKSPSMFLMCLGCFVVGMVVLCFGYLTVMISAKGFSLADAAMVFTCYTLSMGIGSSLMGKISEKAGTKVYLLVTYVCAIGGATLMYLWMRNPGGLAFLVVATLITGIGGSGLNMLSPMMVPVVFGMKPFASLMPIIAGFYAVGSGLGVFYLPVIATQDGGDWTRAMLYAVVTLVVTAVIIAAAYALAPMKKEKNK